MRFARQHRPRWLPYMLWLLATVLVWTAFIMFGSYEYWQHTGNEVIGMGSTLRNGAIAIAGIFALLFVGHWALRNAQSAQASDPTSAPTSSLASAPTEATDPAVATLLAGTDQKYVLEVRSVGLAVDRYYQDDVWRLFNKSPDNHVSVLSQNPKDYPANRDERSVNLKLAASAAFEYAASDAVEYWPLPVIILGPPNGANDGLDMGSGINQARNDAGLGVTLFLWQEDANTASAEHALEDLFTFFDEHPDVPAALIYSVDGTLTRYGWHTPGMPKEPSGHYVPPVPDSMVALLVTRSDRVDKLVRPYAVSDVPEHIDMRDTQYDTIKLWNYFWEETPIYGKVYEKEQADKGVKFPDAPGVMKADWWTAQLPEFWTHITNSGPGQFKPSLYLPVRWTDWQVKQFDDAPVLGYLHRPVHIKLTDDEGRPLKRPAQVEALKQGWDQAVTTLPEGEQPVRVFYDTSLDKEWVIPLTQALHGNPEGIDLNNVEQGYDIGHRVGNTGVSSALVQIGLGTMAGYFDGGASATVNLMPDGDAGIVMISPPDDVTKQDNERRRGKNPFVYRVPGMGDGAPQ